MVEKEVGEDKTFIAVKTSMYWLIFFKANYQHWVVFIECGIASDGQNGEPGVAWGSLNLHVPLRWPLSWVWN